MQKAFALHVFGLMFDEAQRSFPPSRERLALLLNAPREAVDAALFILERAGLANAKTARLTFSGLAVAAATRASTSRASAPVRALAA
jgi:hypothetical protein